MNKKVVSVLIPAIASCFLLAAGAQAEESHGHLEFLQPLIGQKWLGHFSKTGELLDRFYLQTEQVWKQGHLIRYKAEGDSGDSNG